MEEIKVGEYVRINNDFRLIALGIGEVIRINQDTIYVKNNFELPFAFKIGNVTKHRENIIDLIEVGDIVELELSEEFVEREDKIVFTRIGDVYTKELLQRDIDNGIITKILSILTHEQYEANCYKVNTKITNLI